MRNKSIRIFYYFIGTVLLCIISQTLLLLYQNNNTLFGIGNRNSIGNGNGINDYNSNDDGNGINDFNVELILQQKDGYSSGIVTQSTDEMRKWFGSFATITVNNANSDYDNPLLNTYSEINKKTTTTTTTSKRRLFFIHVGKVRKYVHAESHTSLQYLQADCLSPHLVFITSSYTPVILVSA
jgi:hypothetical protein